MDRVLANQVEAAPHFPQLTLLAPEEDPSNTMGKPPI